MYSINKKLHKKKKYKKTNGGKVLGEGNYGCIVHPAYPCPSSKSTKKKVSKLSTDITDKVPIVYQKLKQIKNYKDFFIFPDLSCVIKSSTIKKIDKQNCKNTNLNNQFILNSTMAKGNYDLYNLPPNTTEYTFAKYLLKLLNAIHILSKNNIAHFDIKALNIIIKNNNAFLIDFDDVFNPTNEAQLTEFLYSFSHMTDKYVWAPEIYFQFEYFFDDIPEFLLKYIENSSYKQFITNAMIFSLGLAFDDYHLSRDFTYLIEQMIRIEPNKRISIPHAIKYVKKYLLKK